MDTIILASASPRRKEILSQMDLPFLVKSITVEERTLPGETVDMAVKRLAREKVESLHERFGRKAFPWIVGADTLIELDGKPVGKPANGEEAAQMLGWFSGRTHRVITGVALYNGKNEVMNVSSEATEVVFAGLAQEEISWYVNTHEWQGAAGGYRIQERGACLIVKIDGSYSNVMGLPIRTFYGMLKDSNYPFV